MGKIAFVFSGQGAQYTGMGKSLCEVSPAARAVFEMADRIRPGTSEQCFTAEKAVLSVTANTQPCLFAVDLAAAEEEISPIKYGVLPRGNAFLRFLEDHFTAPLSAGPHLGGNGIAQIADLHGTRKGFFGTIDQIHVFDPKSTGHQIFFITDHHGIFFTVEAHYIFGCAKSETDAAALTDGIKRQAFMTSQNVPSDIEKITGTETMGKTGR